MIANWQEYKNFTKKEFDCKSTGENNMQHDFMVILEAIRGALQSTIDDRAKTFGFSGGNALMLYAGFTNAYQPLAITFATWEATVWVEAETYKAQVVAGTAPMLTPEEAVALMPVYPV